MNSLLSLPSNSTMRGAVVKGLPRGTQLSDEISAFLPNPKSWQIPRVSSGIDISVTDSDTGSPAVRVESPSPLVRINKSDESLPRKIKVLQQWEGVVIEVSGGEFTAELRNLTELDKIGEIAEFPFEEISDADRALVAAGAVFYWSIGYDTTPGGTIRRVSEIRMRRSPEWTENKLRAVKAEADDWYAQLLKDDAETTSQT